MASFLDLEARLSGTFLHPGGLPATRWLVDLVAADESMHRVLELGCGTGSTTVLLTQRLDVDVIALDRSGLMLQAARERLQRGHAAMGRAILLLADLRQSLPFADATFDLVFAESVVALLEPAMILPECARVLRPAGRLVLNERIWRPGLHGTEVDRINAASQRTFGIPAATARPLDRQGWIEELRLAGFESIRSMPVDSLDLPRRPRPAPQQRWARLRAYLARPPLALQSLRYKAAMGRHQDLWGTLEAHLFLAEKAAAAAP